MNTGQCGRGGHGKAVKEGSHAGGEHRVGEHGVAEGRQRDTGRRHEGVNRFEL